MIMEWIFLDLEKLFTVKIINNLRKSQDHWDEAFKDAEIDVSVDTMIRRAGLRTKGVFDRMK